MCFAKSLSFSLSLSQAIWAWLVPPQSNPALGAVFTSIPRPPCMAAISSPGNALARTPLPFNQPDHLQPSRCCMGRAGKWAFAASEKQPCLNCGRFWLLTCLLIPHRELRIVAVTESSSMSSRLVHLGAWPRLLKGLMFPWEMAEEEKKGPDPF